MLLKTHFRGCKTVDGKEQQGWETFTNQRIKWVERASNLLSHQEGQSISHTTPTWPSTDRASVSDASVSDAIQGHSYFSLTSLAWREAVVVFLPIDEPEPFRSISLTYFLHCFVIFTNCMHSWRHRKDTDCERNGSLCISRYRACLLLIYKGHQEGISEKLSTMGLLVIKWLIAKSYLRYLCPWKIETVY